MKIAPLRITEPWLHRLARHDGADVQTLRGVPCDLVVRMEAVSVLHHGVERNHRPYLHLRGRLAEVRPDAELPYGITGLPFHRGSEPVVDAYYEFDDAQLAELVAKGYFGTRFQVPETMIGIDWELPAEADIRVAAPEGLDQPPVAAVSVRGQNDLVVTEESSGYRLADYFPDYSLEGPAQAAAENERPVPTHSGAMRDLFADEEFEDTGHRRPAGPVRRDASADPAARLTSSRFDEIVSEIEARESSKRPGVDYDPDAPAGVLRDRIAPGVEQALSGGARETAADVPDRGTGRARAAAAGTGFLDLEEDGADDYQPGA